MAVARLLSAVFPARRSASGGNEKVLLIGLIALLLPAQKSLGALPAPFISEGRAGFVVSHLDFGLTSATAEAGACPAGLSLNVEEIFARTPEGKRRQQESDAAYAARLRQGGNTFSTAADGQNLCLNPEAGPPDPHFRTVESASIPVFGIDLDGGAHAGAGSCVHADFVGMNGEPGIDNQFYRVVGCSRSYQSSGLSNGFATEMLTGSWGILLTLTGVDDIRNDDTVEVGFFASDDPIQLSPGRDPLPYATYLVDPDPDFRASARGRIKDGVLTTDPTDVQFHSVTNSMYTVRVLRDARLQLTLAENGHLGGYLSGYTPVEAMYDLHFGFRSGRTSAGELAPLRLRSGSANGAAHVLGYTCNGVYHALREHADGHPDPATGKCTSISTQYRIEAIPAFVIEPDEREPGHSALSEQRNDL